MQLQAKVQRLQDAGLLGDEGGPGRARELNTMWEGLANAELRGDVLRIMPKGEEEPRRGHEALYTVRARARRSVDLALAAFPVGAAELELLELAGGGAGELVAELDRRGALEAGQALLAPRPQLVLGGASCPGPGRRAP